MTLVEFIEAISRVADKVDLPHLILDKNEGSKIERHLCYKIESYIIVLIQNILGHVPFHTYIKTL